MKVEKFKSLIKESIKEVLVEEGLLKEVISVALKESQQFNSNETTQAITEAMKNIQTLQRNMVSGEADVDSEKMEETIREHKISQEKAQKQMQKMQELRQKMMDSIGKSSYKDLYNLEGVDLFEGTTPLSRAGVPSDGPESQGPLSGVEPDDAGVAIDSLLGNKKLWQQLMKK